MPVESHVDVLIIGAGPTGIICANALAMASIHTRIIDKRAINVAAGQADGINSRTIEILQSYGLSDRFLKDGNQIYLRAMYSPGPNGKPECTSRIPLVTDPHAPYPFMISLCQADIESNFMEALRNHGIEVERQKQPSSLEILDDVGELSDPSSYPVTVECLNDSRNTEIIHAKYVIGADGAHSWVRRALGIQTEGERTDYVWGVIDLLTESNFPDIRNITDFRSTSGNCLMIPRENDSNRLYIQIPDTDSIFTITAGSLLAVARKILHPYQLADPKRVEWCSLYTIGQRIATKYSVKDRVFIAGDACHTHSPRGGQGMNAGIGDAHNLAWKLVHVLRGLSTSTLLKTYDHERRKFAEDLISLDKEFATLGSRKPKTTENEDGVPTEHAGLKRQGFFTGLGIHYPSSAVVCTEHQNSAINLVVGQRMLPYIFIRAADLRPIDLHSLLPADVRFKIFFFVGNLTSTRIAELESLEKELNKPSSFLHKYNEGGNISSVFTINTIIAAKKHDMNYLLVPALFRPHWKNVFLDDTDLRNVQGGGGYERFGIDARQITAVVVRPDGYVGAIVPSTAVGDLEEYFGSFMIPRKDA